MITPFFEIDQDDEFVHVTVKVSHARFSASALEMVVDDAVFIFSLPPYYLRLRMPFPLVDDERAQARFDSAGGCVRIQLPKATAGQFFPDLDLTAKLLARAGDSEAAPAAPKPLIQELDVDPTAVSSGMVEEGEKHQWEVEQTEAVPESTETVKYGFNNGYSGIVGVSLANGNDINELGDPESAQPTDRVVERLIKENIKFDPEYYAADYIMEKHPSADDDKQFGGIMAWKSTATRQFASWYKHQQQLDPQERVPVMPVEFTRQEQERMLALPRRTVLLDGPRERQQTWALVVSLLFAYYFDLRENEGEHNVESAWTVGKLVPQFAFLDAQLHVAHEGSSDTLLTAALVAAERRALLYPFHRNHKMVRKVWDDVYYTLRAGKRMVLRCLLDVKELFRYHDVYYVYDKIWMDDLCVWMMGDQASEALVRELAHDVKRESAALTKEHITFEKIDDTQDDDAMIALDIAEVEAMANDSYAVA